MKFLVKHKEWLFATLVLVIALNWGSINALRVPNTPPSAFAKGDITLYSAAWCGYCKQARRLLEKEGVVFNELDVETTVEGQKAYASMGRGGIPVLKIKNETIRGYDEYGIRMALRKS